MTTLLNGLLGGLVVGVLAAVAVRFVVGDSSAIAAVLTRFLGVDEPSRWTVFAARVLYGGLAGTALLAVELYAVGLLGVPPTTAAALTVAVGWSALLFVLTALVWRVPFSRPPDGPFLRELFVYHLVFGVGFGGWIRITWIT